MHPFQKDEAGGICYGVKNKGDQHDDTSGCGRKTDRDCYCLEFLEGLAQ